MNERQLKVIIIVAIILGIGIIGGIGLYKDAQNKISKDWMDKTIIHTVPLEPGSDSQIIVGRDNMIYVVNKSDCQIIKYLISDRIEFGPE